MPGWPPPKAPDPFEEIAALRAEVAELRARVAALEDLLGASAAAAPDDAAPDEAAPEVTASIEPDEPWGLNPPGGGAER